MTTSFGLCVLLVEDDEADAYLIGRALADNQVVTQVVHARDGGQALDMIERGEVSPDLALIDLHMPRMDGFDLLVALATRPELTFPRVVLTSSSAPTDAVRSRLRYAARVVIKPDTVAELYAVLKTAIEATCGHSAESMRSLRRRAGPAYTLVASKPGSIRRARRELRVD